MHNSKTRRCLCALSIFRVSASLARITGQVSTMKLPFACNATKAM